MIKLKFFGLGGQGIVTAAKTLSEAVSIYEEEYAITVPAYGHERRGAPVNTSIMTVSYTHLNSINADGKAARRSYGVFRIDVCSRYRLWRDWRQSKVYPRLDGWGPNPVRIWTGFTDVFRDSSRRA